jgi:hypothetical protein
MPAVSWIPCRTASRFGPELTKLRKKQKAVKDRLLRLGSIVLELFARYEHPLVEPQLSHFRQVPLRTIVKLPHSL